MKKTKTETPEHQVVRLERNADHQRYYLSDGTQVSGASSISKMGDSPDGLIWWAWDQGRQGLDYRQTRDAAADAGTIAHFLANCYLFGAEADLREFTEEEIALAMPSYDKFVDFWTKEKLTVVSCEEQLVHEELKYGGTIDVRAVDECGKNVLLDWKSSKKKVYDSHKWQLAGYELLSNFNHPESVIHRRAIIRIGRDPKDTFHAHWIPDSKAKQHMRIFEAQVALYNIINEDKHGKK